MTSFTVEPVPIYEDNYVWCIQAGSQTWVVDPGDHRPVLDYLDRQGSTLSGVLVTHHHWDHITGIIPLLQATNTSTPVFGPSFDIQGVTHLVNDGDHIDLGGCRAEVWETPGHTRDHRSYYLPDVHSLFCGDTLFAAGCGRLFDGTMKQLYTSLQRISSLPHETLIYCTHEYTLANLEFALFVDPDSAALHTRREKSRQMRQAGYPTLPSDLATELATNPFLRTGDPAIQQSVKKAADIKTNDNFLIFAELRKLKNRY